MENYTMNNENSEKKGYLYNSFDKNLLKCG